jgi:hypothetical protein
MFILSVPKFLFSFPWQKYISCLRCLRTEPHHVEYPELFETEGGVRSSVIGWGTMLQAGRSPVRVADEVDCFNWPNLSSRNIALASTFPLTEMTTKNLSGGKKRTTHRTHNLAAICESNVWKMWEPLVIIKASAACTGITLTFDWRP